MKKREVTEVKIVKYRTGQSGEKRREISKEEIDSMAEDLLDVFINLHRRVITGVIDEDILMDVLVSFTSRLLCAQAETFRRDKTTYLQGYLNRLMLGYHEFLDLNEQ